MLGRLCCEVPTQPVRGEVLLNAGHITRRGIVNSSFELVLIGEPLWYRLLDRTSLGTLQTPRKMSPYRCIIGNLVVPAGLWDPSGSERNDSGKKSQRKVCSVASPSGVSDTLRNAEPPENGLQDAKFDNAITSHHRPWHSPSGTIVTEHASHRILAVNSIGASLH